MTDVQVLTKLLAQLHDPKADKVNTLEGMIKVWNNSLEIVLINILKDNIILSSIAKVMNEHYDEWQSSFPEFISKLIWRASNYYLERDLFPATESGPLIAACRKYLMSGCNTVMNVFYWLPGFPSSKQILLEDEELYNTLKTRLSVNVKYYFSNCADNFESWQRKLLEDKQLLLDMINVLGFEEVWGLLQNIALHPDAKLLMPKGIIIEASKSPHFLATDIYTMLCSDEDLKSYKIKPSWVKKRAELLESILNTGEAIFRFDDQFMGYSLLELVLPISNLSIAESYKEKLGKKLIKPLLRVITEDLIDVALIRNNLSRSRLEASRALWNLAFLKSNCALIVEANGVSLLKKKIVQTDDAALKKNITGVLHMCTSNSLEASLIASPATPLHIMISYNWDHQPTVKKIAHSLKERGYNIWIDIERMNGSTLESMAKAVEQSELILMCMSQKYKDSPNCRLEGEYCVNRKVTFVPLMMQKGYAPDGWLGITLGSKLWYDFSDENGWEAKIDGVVKAITDFRTSTFKSPTNTPRVPHLAKLEPKQIINWTPEDLSNWMKEEQIDQHYDAFMRHKLDGRALVELKALLTHHSHFYTFSNFEKNMASMGIEEFGEVLKVSAAIRKL